MVWCRSRYLDLYYPYETTGSTINPIGKARNKKLRLSEQGYLYALVGAKVLESKDDVKVFWLPPYIEKLNALSSDRLLNKSENVPGFYAETYRRSRLQDGTGKDEIIVAFRGSDDFKNDYLGHNLAIFPPPNQFSPARAYLRKVAEDPRVKNAPRLVVTGFSLGGGLASHVALHKDTKKYVNEAWALNPSPRNGLSVTESKPDDRIHVASVYGEALSDTRNIAKLGALNDNATDDFKLVGSNSIYGHYRWNLTRQMLWYADLVQFDRTGRTNPSTNAYKILKNSPEFGCDCDVIEKQIEEERRQKMHKK